MLLGLVLPGMDMTHSHPDNPLENESIREISILKVSDNVEELDDIVVPNQDGVKPTEPEETEPPQETQPRKKHSLPRKRNPKRPSRRLKPKRKPSRKKRKKFWNRRVS